MDEIRQPIDSDISIMLQIAIHNGFMLTDFKNNPWMYAPIAHAVEAGFVQRVTRKFAVHKLELDYPGVILTDLGQRVLDAYLEKQPKHTFICQMPEWA